MLEAMTQALMHTVLAALGAGTQEKTATHSVRRVLTLGAGAALSAAAGYLVLRAMDRNAVDWVREHYDVDVDTGLIAPPDGCLLYTSPSPRDS